MPEPAVVVPPLIALQGDQVGALLAKWAVPAPRPRAWASSATSRVKPSGGG